MRAAVQQYEGPLLRFATRIIGDTDRARDVVQDTFLRLWEADREAIADRMPQWLFTVCRNRALDLRRRDARLDRARDAERASDAVRSAERSNGSDEVIEQRDTMRRALAALDRLPPKQAKVIRMKLGDGMSYREISEATGLTVSYVGWLIHVGMKAIRRELEEAGLAESSTDGGEVDEGR
jgi:RNA polymerase sigma-70 factor (ECF subfamily)